MSSIKIKDDTETWVYYGGNSTDRTIDWQLVNSSTQIVPASGGYYSIATTLNDQGYTFVILPVSPANGTIVGVQVLDNSPTTYAYIQPSGTDIIDFQVAAVLGRHFGQFLERVRYYNGRWFRLDGSYTYSPPPSVGPYLFTPGVTIVPTSDVLISTQSGTSEIAISVLVGQLRDLYLI